MFKTSMKRGCRRKRPTAGGLNSAMSWLPLPLTPKLIQVVGPRAMAIPWVPTVTPYGMTISMW